MTFIVGFLGWSCLLFLLRKQRQQSVDDKTSVYFFPALVGKVAAGLAFAAVYIFHYSGGDSLYQFKIASELYVLFYEDYGAYIKALLSSDPDIFRTDLRSSFFIKIISICGLFGLGNYWFTTLFISLLSFSVTWSLIVRIGALFDINTILLLVTFMLFPSVAFWSSGIVKETFSMMAMNLVLWSVIPIYKRHKFRVLELVMGFVGMWILWKLKYYHAAVLIITIIPLLLYTIYPESWSRLRAGLITLLTIFIVMVIVSMMHYNTNYSRVLDIIVANNAELMTKTEIGKSIVYQNLQPNMISFMVNWPLIFVQGFIGPFPWQSWNFLSLLQSLQGTFLLLIAIIVVKDYRSVKVQDPAIVIAMLFYCFIMTGLLYFSTPNFGTLSRYQVAYLPFVLCLMLQGSTVSQWVEKIRRSV